MQNTRQAIITIESSMIYSLLSQSNIWQYQITLQAKNQTEIKTHINMNGNSIVVSYYYNKTRLFFFCISVTTWHEKSNGALSQCFRILERSKHGIC